MISHQHSCIFIHIPKTGGSSVEKLLWPEEGDKVVSNLFGGFIKPNVNKYQTGGLQHLFSRYVEKEVGSEIFSTYYKFAFVRNPWDKCVSQYLFSMRKKFLLKFLGVRKPVEFKTYLELIQHKRHVQWESQHEFLYSEEGELLVDKVGRFEQFNEDVMSVLNTLGGAELIAKLGDVPHEKKADRAHYSTYYDSESTDIVSKIYAKDIELFNYKFDG